MFGRLLRDYRKKFKISQKTLALLSGVDRSIISRIEKGEEQADTCVQAKIVNLILHYQKHFFVVLDVDIMYFFEFLLYQNFYF